MLGNSVSRCKAKSCKFICVFYISFIVCYLIQCESHGIHCQSNGIHTELHEIFMIFYIDFLVNG